MADIIDLFVTAAEDKDDRLTRERDRGITPSPELVQTVRARYLLGLREKLQKDEEIRAVVTSSFPATDAYEFVEKRAWSLLREGTEDLYRDAIMFLLDELDELRKAGDKAYVVDTSTGEIVAPISENTIVRADTWEDEQGITHIPGPMLNPEIARDLILKSASDFRTADLVRRAADPKTGFAYKHLTEPDRIIELAGSTLERRGHRRVTEESELAGWDVFEITFGEETVEADTQSMNPLHHRLWSYSSILARKVDIICGPLQPGTSFWIGRLRLEKDDERRWYAVHVRVRPPELQ